MTADASIPDFLLGLVDDAAIFPPGNAALDEALQRHREHRAAPHAPLVGGFVVSDTSLPALTRLVASEAEGARGTSPHPEVEVARGTSPHPEVEVARGTSALETPAPLLLNLVVTGGAGAIEGAVRWADAADGIELRAVEFALRDEEDLAHNAQRVLAATDALADQLDGVELYVEPPRVHGQPTAGWLAAADELAAREVRLKFRTGGVTADAFPTSSELATCIGAALDRELPFKCTAGLHHAVRGEAPLPDGGSVDQHGFLNVLVATRANLDGEDTAAVLEETDAAALVDRLDPEVMNRTRRWFTGFGSCSVQEPVDDLIALGLLAR